LSVVEKDKELAGILGVANNQAFSRKWPIVKETNVSDFFARICVEHIVEANLLTKELYLAILIRRKKRPEM
tara:strand:+ start:11614 stop:11826 length:213 start_codon:yes stop_codon:yes gene_type:complete